MLAFWVWICYKWCGYVVLKTPQPLRIMPISHPSCKSAIMTISHHDHQPSWASAIMSISHHEHQPSWPSAIMTISHHDHQPFIHDANLPSVIRTISHHAIHPWCQSATKPPPLPLPLCHHAIMSIIHHPLPLKNHAHQPSYLKAIMPISHLPPPLQPICQ